ncbi:MAG TPA: aminotransferase class III-fold pyridoxal phosphate-dependent enzyme [Spirochaetia bacterium]|nr:aminotransferase class III-fold pyridoxal phosphate-dependent enzyme [Spirochaetia bacterium]
MSSQPRKYSLVPTDIPRIETPNRRIVTKLPVPESLPILSKLERFEPSSMHGQPPLVIDRAEGWSVYDAWGNRWLDWSSGVLISNIGNGHPAIAAALREMIRRPLLSTYVFPHEKRAELVELLAGLAPEPGYKVFLLTTGSEATENCIKLARTWGLARSGPERRVIVSFDNAFHGRTMGAQLAGGSPGQKAWLGKLDASFVQVPFPDDYANHDLRFELFEETLQRKGVKPSQVCGVITESYQGVGPDFLPDEYARRLEAWCRTNGALLIVDEVQAGFGRTGKWFAFEHYGIIPDLIACGKGISGSLPLSAVIGREDVMELYPPGSMTSTHSGSPLPVAAAVASVKAIRDGGYLQNALALDTVLRKGLEHLQALHPGSIGSVRSRGLVGGIRLVRHGGREPDPEAALAVNTACFHKGLLMFAPVGAAGECIKIAPALDIPRDVLDEGLAALGEAMDEVLP